MFLFMKLAINFSQTQSSHGKNPKVHDLAFAILFGIQQPMVAVRAPLYCSNMSGEKVSLKDKSLSQLYMIDYICFLYLPPSRTSKGL